MGGGGALTRSPPHHQPEATTPGRLWRAPRFLLALQGHHLHCGAPPPSSSPDKQHLPPPPPPAARPPPSLHDVFSRVSVALSSRAVPRRRSPPRGRKRPQPKTTRSIADMLRVHPPPPRCGRRHEGRHLWPSGRRALSAFATLVHTAAAAAARQSKHRSLRYNARLCPSRA